MAVLGVSTLDLTMSIDQRHRSEIFQVLVPRPSKTCTLHHEIIK